jgi:hypothetical protein
LGNSCRATDFKGGTGCTLEIASFNRKERGGNTLNIKGGGGNIMIPATEKDLENIMLDFEHFKKLGNGIMKSAWLAASGRGFNEIVKSNKNDILLVRESDQKFIVYSYVDVRKMVKPPDDLIHVIKFHIDESVLKGGNTAQ